MKPTPCVPGFRASSSPTTAPGPVTKLKTPAGRSASATHSASAVPATAVVDAGVQTTVFPHARAGAISSAGIVYGQFQGVITPMTPRGRRRRRTRLPEEVELGRRPSSRFASSAAPRQYWTSSSTSSRDSASGFPWSSVSVWTRPSWRRSTWSATRCIAAARSNALARAQSPAARFAAPIARRASSRPPCWTAPIVSPVAGDSASNVSPDSAVVHSPAMNNSGSAGRFVVDHDAHEVTDREDPDRRAAVDHG